jgi:hypothetical protein
MNENEGLAPVQGRPAPGAQQELTDHPTPRIYGSLRPARRSESELFLFESWWDVLALFLFGAIVVAALVALYLLLLFVMAAFS